MPLFFKDALSTYRTMGMEQVIERQGHNDTGMKKVQMNLKKLYSYAIRNSYKFVKNETPNKKKLSELARSILTANMTMEYDFFEFVKQRLNLQKLLLKKQKFPGSWCNDNRVRRNNYKIW